jgi:hypothetical protein
MVVIDGSHSQCILVSSEGRIIFGARQWALVVDDLFLLDVFQLSQAFGDFGDGLLELFGFALVLLIHFVLLFMLFVDECFDSLLHVSQLDDHQLVLVEVGLEVGEEVRPNLNHILVVLISYLQQPRLLLNLLLHHALLALLASLSLLDFLLLLRHLLALLKLVLQAGVVVAVILSDDFLHVLDELDQVLQPLNEQSHLSPLLLNLNLVVIVLSLTLQSLYIIHIERIPFMILLLFKFFMDLQLLIGVGVV